MLERLYAARVTSTGKLVSDITNPRRKYWDKKGNKGMHGPIELVTFELVEIKD